MDLGPPQGLVGVDVADPGDDRLVEQDPLDGRVLALTRRITARRSYAGSNGSGAMWATGVGDVVGVELGERDPAERPLVDEPQLGAVVGEAEPGVQVPGVRRRPRRAAAHSCRGG